MILTDDMRERLRQSREHKAEAGWPERQARAKIVRMGKVLASSMDLLDLMQPTIWYNIHELEALGFGTYEQCKNAVDALRRNGHLDVRYQYSWPHARRVQVRLADSDIGTTAPLYESRFGEDATALAACWGNYTYLPQGSTASWQQ